jgi:hypothetical protein
MHNQHWGQRCFIIGNGPSLRETDLGRLKEAATFSLNRGYLLFERIGAPTTYHVTVNPLVVEQWSGEILRLPCTKFLTWNRRHGFPKDADLIYIGGPMSDPRPRFSTDVTRELWVGATVTFVAMQLAYYLGFQQAILIGVDHRFRAQGKPHEMVVSKGADVDHFAPDYFGAGARWNLPDLETSERAYTLAREAYRQSGREILDATVGGALQVFPKVRFEGLFP